MISAKFVLDCSVCMSWCFEDEKNKYSDLALDDLATHRAIAPTLWVLEISNVLIQAEKRKRILARDADNFLKKISLLPVVIVEFPKYENLAHLMSHCREFSLTSYDSAYLALGSYYQLPIATLDKNLKKAAKKLNLFYERE